MYLLKSVGPLLSTIVLGPLLLCNLATASSVTVSLGGPGFVCQADCSLDPYPVVGTGRGNYFGQIVSAPQLASVVSLTLDFKYADGLSQPFSQLYYVNVNGRTIGSFSIDGVGDQATYSFDNTFSFNPIFGPTYIMTLSAPVSGNQPGELAWYHDGSSTLTLSDSASTPEPSSALLITLAALFGGTLKTLRRRQERT